MALDTFVTNVRNVSQLYSWSEEGAFLQVRCHLTGEAGDAAHDVEEQTWTSHERCLRESFQPEGQTNLHRAQRNNTWRAPGTSMSNFPSHICKLGKLA